MASEVRFAQVQKLFESHGWRLVRIRGSHHIFSRAGRTMYPVPVHGGKVKASYVKKIEKLFAEEEEKE